MSITKGTIVRTVMLVIVIINMILKHFGLDLIDVEEYQILDAVEMLIEVAVIVVAFWKNNSFTDKAIKADEFLKTLRNSNTYDFINTEDEEIEEESEG